MERPWTARDDYSLSQDYYDDDDDDDEDDDDDDDGDDDDDDDDDDDAADAHFASSLRGSDDSHAL